MSFYLSYSLSALTKILSDSSLCPAKSSYHGGTASMESFSFFATVTANILIDSLSGSALPLSFSPPFVRGFRVIQPVQTFAFAAWNSQHLHTISHIQQVSYSLPINRGCVADSDYNPSASDPQHTSIHQYIKIILIFSCLFWPSSRKLIPSKCEKCSCSYCWVLGRSRLSKSLRYLCEIFEISPMAQYE